MGNVAWMFNLDSLQAPSGMDLKGEKDFRSFETAQKSFLDCRSSIISLENHFSILAKNDPHA